MCLVLELQCQNISPSLSLITSGNPISWLAEISRYTRSKISLHNYEIFKFKSTQKHIKQNKYCNYTKNEQLVLEPFPLLWGKSNTLTVSHFLICQIWAPLSSLSIKSSRSSFTSVHISIAIRAEGLDALLWGLPSLRFPETALSECER